MWKIINKIIGRTDWEKEFDILFEEHEKLLEKYRRTLAMSKKLLELTKEQNKEK